LLHDWVDIDDLRAKAWLAEGRIAQPREPVVLLGGERVLANPQSGDLADAAGLRRGPPAPAASHDLVGVGGRPGGVSASAYSARSHWGGRPQPRGGSRTISAFRPEYRAPSWPSGHRSRRASSGWTSGCLSARSPFRSATVFTSSGSKTGASCSRAASSSRWG